MRRAAAATMAFGVEGTSDFLYAEAVGRITRENVTNEPSLIRFDDQKPIHHAIPKRRLHQPLTLLKAPLHRQQDPLAVYLALKLRKAAKDVEHEPPRRCLRLEWLRDGLEPRLVLAKQLQELVQS